MEVAGMCKFGGTCILKCMEKIGTKGECIVGVGKKNGKADLVVDHWKRKMGGVVNSMVDASKKRNIGWNYGTQGATKDSVNCNFCGSTFNGGIT
ncbi:hypothetical protein H5410_050258 [Solanum commersonii]|uniref:Uncharacterized protein n=1 Tax=Solanum commersonii TaxID=4109 RepID=A0A9J5WWA8_SOLCO|nr:hypothetical protein H5410_050258 [Solanum commersonii]